jgi:hypothetical protein
MWLQKVDGEGGEAVNDGERRVHGSALGRECGQIATHMVTFEKAIL